MIFLSVLMSGLVASTLASRCQRVVCYYTNWAQYRPDPFKFKPENMDTRLCTHINFAFAKMIGNRLAPFEWNDESETWAKGMYERSLDRIKAQNSNAQILLSVGGWNMGSPPFTSMVATSAGRTEFASTSVQFLRERGFHGLDLDWEYPGNRGSPPEDVANYVELLKEIDRVFTSEAVATGQMKLLLTAAVSAGKETIDKGYNVTEVVKYLDFINIMTYDLHGSWESFTGHNSPLYARSNEVETQAQLNVDWAVSYWVSLGLPKHKLVLGLPTYGRTFTLQSASVSNLAATTTGPGKAGTYTREAGFLAYYEICAMKHNGATVVRDAEQSVPYLVYQDQWVGYDDEMSLREKVKYMYTKGYGGVMLWAMDLDDFSGSCGNGNYSLINAIVNECHGIPPSENNRQTNGGLPVSRVPVPAISPPIFPLQTLRSKPSPKASSLQSHAGQTFRQHSARHGSQVRMFQMPVFPVNHHDQTFQKAPTSVQQIVRTSAMTAFVLHDRRINHQPSSFVENVQSRPREARPTVTEISFPTAPNMYLQSPTNTDTQGSHQARPSVTEISFRNAQSPSKLSSRRINTPKHQPDLSSRNAPIPHQHTPLMTIGQNPQPASSSFAKSQRSRTSLLPSNFITNLLKGSRIGRGGGIRVKNFNDDSTEFFNCFTKHDGFYPCPSSCQHFFICKEHVAVRKSCEAGLVYNPGQKYCDWPYNYKCQIDVPAQPQNEPPTGQEDQQSDVSTVATFCDGKPNGRYADPTTCDNYIDCVSYITYIMPCALGTVYSSMNKGCNIPENVPECNN